VSPMKLTAHEFVCFGEWRELYQRHSALIDASIRNRIGEDVAFRIERWFEMFVQPQAYRTRLIDQSNGVWITASLNPYQG